MSMTRRAFPDPTLHPRLYNRGARAVGTKLEYFLTDFLELKDWTQFADFMAFGKEVRTWFEKRTSWQLILSGHCSSDITCKDDHGRQVLNLWRITTDNLDSIPQGLGKLLTGQTSKAKLFGNDFGWLLNDVAIEHHFITTSEGRYSALPRILSLGGKYQSYVPVYVYVEYWVPYGQEIAFIVDFTLGPKGDNFKLFNEPWQFVANLRAISGRVNTYSQYWMRMVPPDVDNDTLAQQLRAEIEHAGWHRKAYRPQRVDLITPSDYDPLKMPRKRSSTR